MVLASHDEATSTLGPRRSDLSAGCGLTAAQIASWSLTLELPDPPGTFVDVLELTEDDLRWLRERPTDPDLKMADDVTRAVDDVVAEGSAQGSVQGFPRDGAAPAVEATPPVDASVPASASEPFWATPGVTPPSVPDAVSPRLAAAQDGIAGLLAGGALSGSRADTEALLRLAEQAQAAALAELAEMDATGGHLSESLRGTTTATWLRDTLRLSDPVARSTVRLAVALRDELPVLELVKFSV